MDAVKDRSAGWEHRCPEEPIDVEDFLSLEQLESIVDRLDMVANDYGGGVNDIRLRDLMQGLVNAVKARG